MAIVGEGDFRYELDETWPNIPEGWELSLCSDVAFDSRDRVYVFNRGIHSIAIFDADSGNFLSSWGEGNFREPHGIFIGPDDSVYLTDRQAHVRPVPRGDEPAAADLATLFVSNHLLVAHTGLLDELPRRDDEALHLLVGQPVDEVNLDDVGPRDPLQVPQP